ncbi:MAG: hypothetical protein IJX14_12640 [Clostridia bacterium]|nr:hypothetical protein [Clostridia bacterium]
MAEKLRFAEENKPPSRLIHDLPGHMVSAQVHKRFHESDDNAGTDALASGVYLTETAVRAVSKAQQKKRIKQEYAQAKRTSQESARASEIAGKAAMTLQEKARQVVAYVANHKGMFIIIGCILALLLVFTSLISSCSIIVQSGLNAIGTTTYPSETEDILEVEEIYQTKEENLQNDLDTYEIRYSGYDEYRISGEVEGHDPHVLASILSAVYGDYTPEDVDMFLNTIFSLQYRLTETVRRETRYRIVDGERVPYLYTICTVTLTCTPLEDLAQSLLTEEQYEMYEIYMTTSGNQPELFS